MDPPCVVPRERASHPGDERFPPSPPASVSPDGAIGGPHAPWYPADRAFVNRFFRSALFPLFVIVLLVYLASQTLIPHGKNTQKLTLSDFTQRVQQGEVQSAEFTPSKRAISFKLTDGKK